MEIRLNTDNNFTASEGFLEKVSVELKKKLHRFSEYLTTAEVFFGDENSGKSGTHDKRCTIEVRPRNLNPEAVTHFADTVDHAFNGAVDKIRNLLDSRIGKLQNKV
ncbi:HPF/RaiA family ribosome-associated protein [Niabella aurantiaca]|uniref:HPF/RaiA family ribosome-associated protein n=1 Tax=Niabella aurantiaca TaxID=379900 RepID=UPI00035F8905|nr:HPF/RaiA family ribosome-associated protein [Niabella aurantiaca]